MRTSEFPAPARRLSRREPFGGRCAGPSVLPECTEPGLLAAFLFLLLRQFCKHFMTATAKSASDESAALCRKLTSTHLANANCIALDLEFGGWATSSPPLMTN